MQHSSKTPLFRLRLKDKSDWASSFGRIMLKTLLVSSVFDVVSESSMVGIVVCSSSNSDGSGSMLSRPRARLCTLPGSVNQNENIVGCRIFPIIFELFSNISKFINNIHHIF